MSSVYECSLSHGRCHWGDRLAVREGEQLRRRLKRRRKKQKQKMRTKNELAVEYLEGITNAFHGVETARLRQHMASPVHKSGSTSLLLKIRAKPALILIFIFWNIFEADLTISFEKRERKLHDTTDVYKQREPRESGKRMPDVKDFLHGL